MGGGGSKKTRFEWEFTTQYSQSFLFISETLNKGYQMIISKLNESVILFWVIFDNSGVKQETMTVIQNV